MNRLDVVSQLFVKRDNAGIKLIAGKVIDDFLVAGSTSDIKDLFTELER